MSVCPSCHQSIEISDKHLGTLFTCSSCSAVFFINWDGQPELAAHESEDQEAEPYHPEQNNEDDQNLGFGEGIPQYGEAPTSLAIVPLEQEPEYQTEEVVSEGEDPYDFSATLDQPLPQPHAHQSNDSSDFSDVTEFGNANFTVGPLSYVVIIDGLESSLLVKQLREAMTDSRFAWDVNELLSHISAGRLILEGLSPAKASTLIGRIKYLPFKISWRQDVLSGG